MSTLAAIGTALIMWTSVPDASHTLYWCDGREPFTIEGTRWPDTFTLGVGTATQILIPRPPPQTIRFIAITATVNGLESLPSDWLALSASGEVVLQKRWIPATPPLKIEQRTTPFKIEWWSRYVVGTLGEPTRYWRAPIYTDLDNDWTPYIGPQFWGYEQRSERTAWFCYVPVATEGRAQFFLRWIPR